MQQLHLPPHTAGRNGRPDGERNGFLIVGRRGLENENVLGIRARQDGGHDQAGGNGGWKILEAMNCDIDFAREQRLLEFLCEETDFDRLVDLARDCRGETQIRPLVTNKPASFIATFEPAAARGGWRGHGFRVAASHTRKSQRPELLG